MSIHRRAFSLIVSMISVAALFFMWLEVVRQLAAYSRGEAVPPGFHAYCEFFNFTAAGPGYYAAGFILWFSYAGLASWLIVALSGALQDVIQSRAHGRGKSKPNHYPPGATAMGQTDNNEADAAELVEQGRKFGIAVEVIDQADAARLVRRQLQQGESESTSEPPGPTP